MKQCRSHGIQKRRMINVVHQRTTKREHGHSEINEERGQHIPAVTIYCMQLLGKTDCSRNGEIKLTDAEFLWVFHLKIMKAIHGGFEGQGEVTLHRNVQNSHLSLSVLSFQARTPVSSECVSVCNGCVHLQVCEAVKICSADHECDCVDLSLAVCTVWLGHWYRAATLIFYYRSISFLIA